jgi:hypothetical protein
MFLPDDPLLRYPRQVLEQEAAEETEKCFFVNSACFCPFFCTPNIQSSDEAAVCTLLSPVQSLILLDFLRPEQEEAAIRERNKPNAPDLGLAGGIREPDA